MFLFVNAVALVGHIHVPLCKWRAGLRLSAMHELYLGPYFFTDNYSCVVFYLCFAS